MFNSGILDVALGLSLVYLLLSTLCLVANELIELVARARARGLARGIRDMLQNPALVERLCAHPLIRGLHPQGRPPSYIPTRAFAASLMHLVFPDGGIEGVDGPGLRTLIKETTSPLVDEHLKAALLALLDRAGGRADRLRGEVEAWYDQAMDRVAGRYKGRTQWLTLAVSALVVTAANVDTIALVRELSSDPAKRAAVVAIAEERAKQAAPAPAPPLGDSDRVVNSGSAAGSGSRAVSYGAGDPGTKLATLADSYAELDNLGLSFGWSEPPRAEGLWWLKKLVGLLITVLAVSLGAPFWFDVLNKIIVVRSTVKPREKSPEEASKGAT